MTLNFATPAPEPGPAALQLRADIAAEREAVAARRRDAVREIDASLASIAAIKGTWIYRLTRLVRLVVPRRSPLPEAVSASADAGSAAAVSSAPEAFHEKAARWRDPLEPALAREQLDLARLEDESRRVKEELRHLLLSRPRRAWIAARGSAVYAKHPFWTLGAVSRALSNRGVLGGIAAGWHRFRWNTDLFRFLPFGDQHTDQSRVTDAVRWIPPVLISSQTRHALFMHPNSSVTFRLEPPAGSTVVADCGLLPSVWANNHGGVQFDLEVSVPSLNWRDRRTMVVNPGDRFVDRRWRTMTIPLPPGALPEVNAVLSTAVPSGISGAHAWSLWGEPRIEWRRTPRDMWRSVRALLTRLRHTGISGTLTRLRELRSSDEHAALFRRWMALHTPTSNDLSRMSATVASFSYRPRISVITPVYNTDPRWLRACIESVRAQAYPDWELCLADDGSTAKGTGRLLREYEALGDPRIRVVHLPANLGISGASNAALGLATGEFFAMLDHDDELVPEALFEVVRFLQDHPDADWIYSDEDKLDATGARCDPYFKPDWSPEHFLSTMYTCHLMVLRASLVREVGGFRTGYDGAQDYDLALRISERSQRIHHITKILYHWRKIPESVASSGAAKTWASVSGGKALQDHVTRSGIDASVEPGQWHGLYRVRHRIAGKPLVSIILPTAGRSRDVDGKRMDLLENCVRSIAEKSTYDSYEIVIADDGVISDAAERLLAEVPHVRLHYSSPGVFNYARKINFIVRNSKGSQLILFNDDIEVITPGWIEAMLEYSQQEAIGVVGSRLLYPDGRLQHIGVVMGVCGGLAAHAFHSHSGSTPGYGSSAVIVRNYSAVTAACMMTRRELFERMNGFDEQFVFDFNDTDYCLKLRRENYRVVYTPYAELYHLESATVSGRTWNVSDLEIMKAKWADVCERDPYYNPHLTRDYLDCRVRV